MHTHSLANSPINLPLLGVSSIPEVFQYDLTALYGNEIYVESKENDCAGPGSVQNGSVLTVPPLEVAVRCVILVATDGLYDMMCNDKAVEIAFSHWGDPNAAAEEMIETTGTFFHFFYDYY